MFRYETAPLFLLIGSLSEVSSSVTFYLVDLDSSGSVQIRDGSSVLLIGSLSEVSSSVTFYLVDLDSSGSVQIRDGSSVFTDWVFIRGFFICHILPCRS